MTQIKTIFLDLDGVCTEWYESVLRLFPSAIAPATGPLPYWIHEFLNVPEFVIHAAVDKAGIDWWSNLPESPWFGLLYDYLCEFGPKVVFLTSPSVYQYAPSGKMKWLQKRFGPDFDNFVITSQKHLLANSSSVLIDDSPDMIRRFREAGGKTILFPQRWNGNISHCSHPLAYVFATLRELGPFQKSVEEPYVRL